LKHDGGLAHSNRHALAVLPEDHSLKEKKENCKGYRGKKKATVVERMV
jgi:hypothetical protein